MGVQPATLLAVLARPPFLTSVPEAVLSRNLPAGREPLRPAPPGHLDPLAHPELRVPRGVPGDEQLLGPQVSVDAAGVVVRVLQGPQHGRGDLPRVVLRVGGEARDRVEDGAAVEELGCFAWLWWCCKRAGVEEQVGRRLFGFGRWEAKRVTAVGFMVCGELLKVWVSRGRYLTAVSRDAQWFPERQPEARQFWWMTTSTIA